MKKTITVVTGGHGGMGSRFDRHIKWAALQSERRPF